MLILIVSSLLSGVKGKFTPCGFTLIYGLHQTGGFTKRIRSVVLLYDFKYGSGIKAAFITSSHLLYSGGFKNMLP